jgi:hemoglobin
VRQCHQFGNKKQEFSHFANGGVAQQAASKTGIGNMTVTLYDRLGGYDAIVIFATKLVGQAQADSLLGRFWSNRGEDRIARELQVLIDYLVRETGGQMYYTGRDMATTHAGMGITNADWTRFIDIVMSVAGELGVGAPEGGEVLDFLNSLKGDIVTA